MKLKCQKQKPHREKHEPDAAYIMTRPNADKIAEALEVSNLFWTQDARLPRLVAKWRTPTQFPQRRVWVTAKLLRLVEQVARLAIGFTRL